MNEIYNYNYESILVKDSIWCQKEYDNLISNCKQKELENKYDGIYTEVHHIIPECLGGTSDITNLCKMSAEEHIIAHLLLSGINPNHAGLLWAALVMLVCNNNGLRTEAQKNFSRTIIDEIKDRLKQEGLTGIPKRTKKRKINIDELIEENLAVIQNQPQREYTRWNKDTIEKMSKSKLGINHNLYGFKHNESSKELMKQAQLGEKNHFYGKNHSQLSKDKISFTKTHDIKAPDGTIYKTIKEAAKAGVISKDKLSSWLYSDDTHGYEWVDKIK